MTSDFKVNADDRDVVSCHHLASDVFLMSIPQLQGFVEACDADQGLQSKVIAIGEDYESIVALGSSLGFAFSIEDLLGFKNHQVDESIDEELALEDLMSVAGGRNNRRYWWCPFC